MRASAALLALAVLATSVPAQAKCAYPTRSPDVMTKGELPAGTGVLVGTDIFVADEDEGEAFQPTWVWKDAKGTTKPTVKVLAPGLVVYAVPAGVTSAELHDGTKARATVTVGAASKSTLAAPDVEDVGHTIEKSSRGTSASTSVLLTSPAPAGAVAMIIYDAKTKRALSYGVVTPGMAFASVYSRSRCEVVPDGTVVPKVKQRVVLRYVDQFGRLSPASKPQTIKKSPPPEEG